VGDLPAVVGDEKEDVEGPIGDRLDDQEVRSSDPLDLVGKKRSPSLGAWWHWLPPPISADPSGC
jgi:hypothetical protein